MTEGWWRRSNEQGPVFTKKHTYRSPFAKPTALKAYSAFPKVSFNFKLPSTLSGPPRQCSNGGWRREYAACSGVLGYGPEFKEPDGYLIMLWDKVTKRRSMREAKTA